LTSDVRDGASLLLVFWAVGTLEVLRDVPRLGFLFIMSARILANSSFVFGGSKDFSYFSIFYFLAPLVRLLNGELLLVFA
jgi:hypothetical protein